MRYGKRRELADDELLLKINSRNTTNIDKFFDLIEKSYEILEVSTTRPNDKGGGYHVYVSIKRFL